MKVQKSSNDLIKLVGPDSSAGKRMDQEFNDLNTCHVNLCNDTLARLKKVGWCQNYVYSLPNISRFYQTGHFFVFIRENVPNFHYSSIMYLDSVILVALGFKSLKGFNISTYILVIRI